MSDLIDKPYILRITKGRPFERDDFFKLFDSLDVNLTRVEQPAARAFCSQELQGDYDALVMQTCPVFDFVEEILTSKHQVNLIKKLMGLLDVGKGMVFMHHAIAAWPAWEEYAEIVGGRLLYQAG